MAADEEPERGVQLSLPVGAQEEETAGGEPDEVLHTGPVPRVSMDYFYLFDRSQEEKKGGQALSTKELQRKLREMGNSDKGSRQDLVRRYEREIPPEEEGGEVNGGRQWKP